MAPESIQKSLSLTNQDRIVSEDKIIKQIVVYICPREDCRNYYGASGMSDLSKEFSGPKIEDKHAHAIAHGSEYTKSMADCPDCWKEGRGRVARVPVRVNIPVPTEEQSPADLPLPTGKIHPIRG